MTEKKNPSFDAVKRNKASIENYRKSSYLNVLKAQVDYNDNFVEINYKIFAEENEITRSGRKS